MATPEDTPDDPHARRHDTLLGHPVGLYTLFFAEMWERFSFYGMRALLVLYMIKGFLAMNDGAAYAVYGAYTALVYATPFIGGMLADRLLGARRAVVFGGLLMAAGHLMMTMEVSWAFYLALALLIAGNGFFKPNISSMVGELYPPDSTRRDGGFTIFYMGINLGGALAPLLCGYVGETYGWHYGFGLATVGMLTGVAIFVAPTRLTQALVLGSAVAVAVSLVIFQNNIYSLAVNLFVGVILLAAAAAAVVALNRGGLPAGTGEPPAAAQGKARWPVYVGTLAAVPVFMQLVQPTNTVSLGPLGEHDLAGALLIPFGLLAFGWLLVEAFRSGRIERDRMFVVLILTFFSLLFWAFFEQAGSSMNNFTDRNVDRVIEARRATAADVGTTLELRIPLETADPALAGLPPLTQEQLGRRSGSDAPLTITALDALRNEAAATADRAAQVRQWTIAPGDEGMGIGGSEIRTSQFQAANSVFILTFGLPFTLLWTALAARRREPSTPVKFALGLLQLGLGFVALWYGAQQADPRGMVAVGWLLLGYLLHTTGELCVSPVGLSMVTKLSPHRLVSTVMGAWFLATAFSQYLAALIAQLTGVRGEGEGAQVVPPPSETVHLYGDVFGQIAIIAVASSLVCLALSPLLRRWMHEGE
jgi:POT family proton-dependent oligopeptide transporter